MTDPASLLVLLSRNPGLRDKICHAVAPFGWRCGGDTDLAAVLATLENHMACAIVLDAGACDPADAVRQVRALPAPVNGTPILVLGDEEVRVAGAGGHLAPPIEIGALLGLLEHWAGPLNDHALRAVPLSPRWRLIRLVGFANAESMLDRFRLALEEAIAAADDDPETVPAHRLAGLAGLIGYTDLHAAWSRVDAGEADALAEAIEASRGALRGEPQR